MASSTTEKEAERLLPPLGSEGSTFIHTWDAALTHLSSDTEGCQL